MLKQLRSQLLRINLQWGGPNAVARRRPARPTDPEDPAYNWAEYDRTVNYAQQYGLKVVFAIIGTPPWANKQQGAERRAARTRSTCSASRQPRRRATAARTRRRTVASCRRCSAGSPGTSPTTRRSCGRSTRRCNGQQVIQSAIDYAKICNAIVKGIRVTRVGASKVACGVTGPRGNNNPNTSRPSVAPLAVPARDEEGRRQRARPASPPTRITRTTASPPRRRRRRRRKARAASRPLRSPSATSTRSSPR